MTACPHRVCQLCGLDLVTLTDGSLRCICCSPGLWTSKNGQDGACQHRRVTWKKKAR